jgi:glycerol uptake facilitator-like aquaporin
MQNETFSRRIAAEFLGTAMLLAAVVGSGIMAERLAGGAGGVALLANTIATGAALLVLILAFGPISGAHLNPAVSLSAHVNGELSRKDSLAYVLAQVSGGVLGVSVANMMFDLPALFVSGRVRTGAGLWLGEFVASFGLVGVIIAVSRRHPVPAVAAAVASFITAAYWFTSSTSFANPAVTIGRSLTDTFTGIRPLDVPAFGGAQLLGGVAAALFFNWLVTRKI